MPPNLSVPECPPSDRGARAATFLEHHGLIPRIPPIRSSDLGLCGAAPFTYYLTRRLGLVPLFRYSQALSHGSWFHSAFELYALHPDAEARNRYDKLIEARLEELSLLCKGVGWVSDRLVTVLERERLDALSALTWYLASRDFKIPNNSFLSAGYEGYFAKPHWRLLGCETIGKVPYKDTHLLAQFDRLYLNEKTNKVWIVDAKTTGAAASLRAQSFPCSFQLRHYLYILDRLAKSKQLHKTFDLPPGAGVGGMIHPIIQKPSITLGQKDRNYHYIAEGKRTGVSGTAQRVGNQWKVALTDGYSGSFSLEEMACNCLHERTGKKPSKAYAGEPCPLNYCKRVRDWYFSEGDYEGEQAMRQAEPPVNVSAVSFGGFDLDEEEEYLSQVEFIYSHATRPATPNRFFRTEDGMSTFGRPSHFAPFYLTPITRWPDIIETNHFTVLHREDETSHNLTIEGEI